MHAIILAAGVGSRLRPLTDTTPKCLVNVAGRPILGWQIDALLAAGAAPITVVAGYRAADVVAYCKPFGDAVKVAVNSDYDRTNNMVSLRLALGSCELDDTFICNGDVVFDPSIARLMARQSNANLIAVERARYIEESMKVSVDSSGRISAISKAIGRERAYGVSIDVYRFSADAATALCRTADRFIEAAGEANLWTEVAIDAILAEVSVRPFDINNRRWIEIDNFEDLAQGERLFGVAVP